MTGSRIAAVAELPALPADRREHQVLDVGGLPTAHCVDPGVVAHQPRGVVAEPFGDLVHAVA
nr:hypothetical protein [Streptomyces sp. SP2-10]